MKPHIHAENSAKQFGGKASDYLAIHQFLDSSKAVIADHRHRALTHNTWFIAEVLPRVFGDTITNSDGHPVSVRDVGEQHVSEDFRGKFIPSAQDWIGLLPYRDWMNNGESGTPDSTPDTPANVHKHKIIVDGTRPFFDKPLPWTQPDIVPLVRPNEIIDRKPSPATFD